MRLSELGHSIGLLNEERYARYLKLKEDIASLSHQLREIRFKPKDTIMKLLIEKRLSKPLRRH